MDVIILLVILSFVLWLQMNILCRFVFRKLDYRCEFSVPEAHEGDTIYLIETVYNGKLLPVPWLKVDIHTSRWLDYAGACSVVTQNGRRVTSSYALKSYQKTTRRWKLKCMKRGIFNTENVTLIGGDLLNYSTVSIAMPVNAVLTVFPEIVDLDGLFIPVNLQQSDKTVKRWIIDDPFIVSGAREYTPGDPLNRIHWPASATSGKLMVRKNEFTSQQNLTVLLNMQSNPYEHNDITNKKTAELGIKVAATLFDQALGEGIPVRFGTNGCTDAGRKQLLITRCAADKDHIKGLFEILAGLSMKIVNNFETLLKDISAEAKNTETVIVTAYLDREICQEAGRLDDEGSKVCIILLDTEYENAVVPENTELYILADSILSEAKERMGE